MAVIGSWLCALVCTALLGAGIWFGMKYYGAWSMKRDERERELLQQEWKRRADERKAKSEGRLPTAEGEDETGENPPMY